MHRPVHPMIPRITIIMYIFCSVVNLCPRMDDKINKSGKLGKLPITSAIRQIIISTTPPKYPAKPPNITPSMVLISTATAPTVMVVRPPWMIRVSMSRPNSSVPSR